MGIYHLLVCDSRREYLDPLSFHDNPKWPVGATSVALFNLLCREWSNCPVRVVMDTGDEYFWLQGDYLPSGDAPHDYPYVDVSSRVIEEHPDAFCGAQTIPVRIERAYGKSWLARALCSGAVVGREHRCPETHGDEYGRDAGVRLARGQRLVVSFSRRPAGPGFALLVAPPDVLDVLAPEEGGSE
jgi:hypothetical protein